VQCAPSWNSRGRLTRHCAGRPLLRSWAAAG